jgi:AtzE family amidohydrolase
MTTEWLGAWDVARAVRSGELSARQAVEAAIDRARGIGQKLNCYVEVLEGRALSEADRVDAKRRQGAELGPLAGVPVAVKNLFDVAGVVTLAGSAINREYPPAKTDATALKRLSDAGAVLVGTLGMDEYAYGFTNENTHYGPVRNPHDTELTAGGSSGGSGAAVAGGCVPIALGSDTNGSVRVPAGLCGLFGLKPTFGRVSRAGTVPFTASLDHVGCLTRSARDASLVFDIMHGADEADPVSSRRPREETLASLEGGISGLRVARAVEYFEEHATQDAIDAARAVAAALETRATTLVPEAKAARHAAMILSAVEGSALHFDNLRKRPADFDPMTRDRFLAGALVPGEAYVRAQTFRRAYQDAVRRVFEEVDIVIAPATPMVAPRIGQETIEIEGTIFPSRVHLGRFTQPISFIGLPVVVVPVRTSNGLPMGVQLIGRPYQESALLRVARHLEKLGVVSAFRPKGLEGSGR